MATGDDPETIAPDSFPLIPPTAVERAKLALQQITSQVAQERPGPAEEVPPARLWRVHRRGARRRERRLSDSPRCRGVVRPRRDEVHLISLLDRVSAANAYRVIESYRQARESCAWCAQAKHLIFVKEDRQRRKRAAGLLPFSANRECRCL